VMVGQSGGAASLMRCEALRESREAGSSFRGLLPRQLTILSLSPGLTLCRP
jgi:hypothetical protein